MPQLFQPTSGWRACPVDTHISNTHYKGCKCFCVLFLFTVQFCLLPPLWAGEAAHQSPALAWAEKACIAPGKGIAFEVHSLDDLVYERPVFKRMGSTFWSRKAA